MIYEHRGADVSEVLGLLHKHLRPETYLEIGTSTGVSLRLASCASIAVDPHFKLDADVVGTKPCCLLYQMPSDAFFAKHDPKQLLGAPVDLAYLDGLHLFEVLLRDFIHLERYCRRNSVIVLHDCIPPHSEWAGRRITNEGAWTGDVWKVPIILKRMRLDLKVYALDAAPTGAILITNLDGTSQLLAERYFDIIDEYRHLSLSHFGPAIFLEELQIHSVSDFGCFEDISSFFWTTGEL